VTEALITDLASIGPLKVISRNSVMRYKGSEKSLLEIAHELRVDALITGAVVRVGDRVRITAQLVDPDTEEHLWANRYERDLRDVLVLQSDVVEAITRQIKVTLTPEQEARLAQVRQIDPKAHEAYLKGRYFLNQFTEASIQKGIEFLQQAVAIDSIYAEAYVGLAYAYYLIAIGHGEQLPADEACQRLKENTTIALELDESHAEAHAVLSNYYLNCGTDWANAEGEFMRALELNPNSADAHKSYAFYLSAFGRHQDAVAEMRKAQELDPVSAITVGDVGVILYVARRYKEAIDQFRQALELNPDLAPCLGMLGLTYGVKGMFQEAVQSTERAVALTERSAQWLAVLGWAYGLSGRRTEAERILQELGARSKQDPVQAIYFAWVHIGVGSNEQALGWLEKACAERSDELQFLGQDPMYDPLRNEPRFQELLRLVRLSG
jgi:tetratricopeptide (TPR) repeat protein